MLNRLTLLLATSALFIFAGDAAASNYGMAGCGLGAMLFKDEPGKMQIIAATSNMLPPQSFAITSGTSGCYEVAGDAAELFIAVNREALQKDISRGDGESLAHLSELMGCSDVGLLGTSLQRDIKSVFPSEASSRSVSHMIRETIRKNQKLALSCTRVI